MRHPRFLNGPRKAGSLFAAQSLRIKMKRRSRWQHPAGYFGGGDETVRSMMFCCND